MPDGKNLMTYCPALLPLRVDLTDFLQKQGNIQFQSDNIWCFMHMFSVRLYADWMRTLEGYIRLTIDQRK